MKIANNLLELVGNTPLMQVSAFSKQMELATPLWVKIEAFNPSGSVKARAALAMVEDAEQAGLLKPGATIIEPTSGNTGIGLAMVATVKGYHLMLTMPETMSVERRNLLAAYGAELVLTPGSEGMAGAIAKAEELHRTIPGSFIPGQFDNPANPAIHERTTAREIWADTDGRITAFVAGVGTGGTLCGTGRCLKQLNPAIRVVGVEPASSPVLQGGVAGPHGLQGIGANFVPANYDAEVVDEVMGVTDEEAFNAARTLAQTEGLLVGISSGAALAAAVRLSRSMTDATGIVVLLPDSGERYLSTGLFD
ncbi:MAG: cysteine synthase A [Bacteroides sp.]|nr:cysteine synthase A [Bacteroides sp.]